MAVVTLLLGLPVQVLLNELLQQRGRSSKDARAMMLREVLLRMHCHWGEKKHTLLMMSGEAFLRRHYHCWRKLEYSVNDVKGM